MLRFTIACVLLVSVAFAPAQDDANKQDLKMIQGKWKIISVINDGKALDPDGPGHRSYTISGTKVVYDENTSDDFILDATKKPKMWNGASNRRGEVTNYLAIYSIEADELKICVSARGKERPSTFESVPGSGTRLITLKRVAE